MAQMKEPEYLILIGKNIAKFRKAKGFTIKELGYRCDIEKSNLIPIEKGRMNTTAITLLKIAKALNIEVKALFDFEPSPGK
jgi:transcriptional regulator with XRE-family HTH domain